MALAMTLAALGGLWGAYEAAKAGRESINTLRDNHNDRQAWYNREYNANYLDRPDNQALLTKQRELLTEAYRQARGRNAVAGGSDDALMALKDSANQSVAATTSSAAIANTSRRDAVKQAQMADNDRYANQMAALKQQQGQAIANAAGQLTATGAQILGSQEQFGQWGWLMGGKKKKADGAKPVSPARYGNPDEWWRDE